jgi:hypothetical protein
LLDGSGERRHHLRSKQLDRLVVAVEHVRDEVLETGVGEGAVEGDRFVGDAGEEGGAAPRE